MTSKEQKKKQEHIEYILKKSRQTQRSWEKIMQTKVSISDFDKEDN